MLKTRPPSEPLRLRPQPVFPPRRRGRAAASLYRPRRAARWSTARLIPAKTGAGEADLQARNLSFDNYTFLKQAASAQRLSRPTVAHRRAARELALYPNLNVDRPGWRGLLRDVRFRRALSLAIDRHEINQVVYFGLALEGQNTVLPAEPALSAGVRASAWAQFDLAEANRLLDELGLKQRGGDGMRLLPDGRPLEHRRRDRRRGHRADSTCCN